VTPKDIVTKSGNFVSIPICTIMQNCTPIGVTVTEISVTGQVETKTEKITADLISEKNAH